MNIQNNVFITSITMCQKLPYLYIQNEFFL